MLEPIAQAVVPPPDGGYPRANTAEGEKAFFTLTTGTFNAAVGFIALKSNDLGNHNTTVGSGAPSVNILARKIRVPEPHRERRAESAMEDGKIWLASGGEIR